MELKRVMMFSVGCLATPPEEQQSVLPGSVGVVSLLDLITEQCPHVFNWVDVRGLCRPVHHYNPSISEECCANSGSVWSSVVMLKHLYLWMVLHEWLHLLLQDFVPVLHSIEVPLDYNKISAVQSRNPDPHHERCTPPYLSVSLMHGSASLSFLLFHTLPPPSTSITNGLSSDIRI